MRLFLKVLSAIVAIALSAEGAMARSIDDAKVSQRNASQVRLLLLKKFSLTGSLAGSKEDDETKAVRQYTGPNLTMMDEVSNFGHLYISGRDAEVLYDLLEVEPSAKASLGSGGTILTKEGITYDCFSHFIPESDRKPLYSCSLFIDYFQGRIFEKEKGPWFKRSASPPKSYLGNNVSLKIDPKTKLIESRISLRGLDAKVLHRALQTSETPTSWDPATTEKIGPHFRCYKTKQAELFYFRCVFDFKSDTGAVSPLM